MQAYGNSHTRDRKNYTILITILNIWTDIATNKWFKFVLRILDFNKTNTIPVVPVDAPEVDIFRRAGKL